MSRQADLEKGDRVLFTGEPHFASPGDWAILEEKVKGMWRVLLVKVTCPTARRPQPAETDFDEPTPDEYWFEEEFERLDISEDEKKWKQLLPETSYAYRHKLEKLMRV